MENHTKAMNRRTPLSRTTPLRPVSAKQRGAKGRLGNAYRVVDAGPRACFACGSSFQLTHSHTLTQKQFPRHAANPANVVLECIGCHALYEHNKAGYALRFPEAFAAKLATIRQLEPQYYALQALKHPNLFTV
ncbi:hypothetical protein [Hymenobacter koreensis]